MTEQEKDEVIDIILKLREGVERCSAELCREADDFLLMLTLEDDEPHR